MAVLFAGVVKSKCWRSGGTLQVSVAMHSVQTEKSKMEGAHRCSNLFIANDSLPVEKMLLSSLKALLNFTACY